MTDRQFAVSLLCGLCLLLGSRLGHATQHMASTASFSALTRVDGVTWGDVDTVWLSGLAVPVRPFQADGTLSSLAQRFIQAQPQLRRMLVAGGSLLLSGMDGPHHLAIQLQRSGSGVIGFATMLDTAWLAQRDSSSDLVAGNEIVGLPSGAVRVFALQQASGAGSVRQTIHWMDASPAILAPQFDSRLQRQGWQPWRNPASPDVPDSHRTWQLHGDVLMLLPDPATQGSLLYQLRHEDREQP